MEIRARREGETVALWFKTYSTDDEKMEAEMYASCENESWAEFNFNPENAEALADAFERAARLVRSPDQWETPEQIGAAGIDYAISEFCEWVKRNSARASRTKFVIGRRRG